MLDTTYKLISYAYHITKPFLYIAWANSTAISVSTSEQLLHAQCSNNVRDLRPASDIVKRCAAENVKTVWVLARNV